MKLTRFKIGFLGLTVLALTGCQAPKTSLSNTDNKGLMVHNQNVHIIENTRLSTVDISKVASFRMLTSSTEGLFRLGKNGHVNLGLAESYKISHAGKQYIFKLRPNARWSNGEPITAQDFVYSWRRTVSPRTHSVNANIFDGIKNAAAIRENRLPVSRLGVTATAKKTLKITLDHPIYYFTRLLAYPLFAPQHPKTVATYGKQYGQSAAHQLYSGPFKLVKWHHNANSRTLEPNPYYWDRRHVYLHSLTFTCSKSPQQNLAQFRAGKVAEIQLIGDQIPKNEGDTDYVVRPFALMRFISYNFNTADKTIRKLIHIRAARLAITHAIDRNDLIDHGIKTASLAPRGFVPAGLTNNNRTNADFTDQNKYPGFVRDNRPKARQEWLQAKKILGKKDVTINLSTPNDPTSLAAAQNLQKQLQDTLPGLMVKVVSYQSDNTANVGLSGHYQLLLTGWGADYPDPLAFFQIMTTNSQYNFGHWHNEYYDKLVSEVTEYRSDNPETRWQQMIRTEGLLMKEQPVVPLYQQANSYLTNPRLNGVVYNVSGVPSDYKSAYLVK
ncbi:peptide ABC transporter substrate-binding protein [uncultured Secundilactobacillus sp.]|uniref:peptide ABC transporter substrate-binding protein n=1 Tax=uncultured Secundilactobacillus sp. TaxID=2813935 RepID=UPI00258365C4|nr:peptide ABC transporter substrate-binding protein [uncultured Secundilactobacillus sp.]